MIRNFLKNIFVKKTINLFLVFCILCFSNPAHSFEFYNVDSNDSVDLNTGSPTPTPDDGGGTVGDGSGTVGDGDGGASGNGGGDGTLGGVCGNNIVEAEEQCDPPNDVGCSNTCKDLCGIPDVYLSTDDGITEEKLTVSSTGPPGPLPKSEKVITYVLDGKCPTAPPCPDCVKEYYKYDSYEGCALESFSDPNDIKNCVFFQFDNLNNCDVDTPGTLNDCSFATSSETSGEISNSLEFRTKFDKKAKVKQSIQKNLKAVIAYTENKTLSGVARNMMLPANQWPGWNALGGFGALGASTRNLYFAATRQGTVSYFRTPPGMWTIARGLGLWRNTYNVDFHIGTGADPTSRIEIDPVIALMDFQSFEGPPGMDIHPQAVASISGGGTGSLNIDFRFDDVLPPAPLVRIRPFNHANFIAPFTFALFSKLADPAIPSLTAAFDAISQDDDYPMASYWRNLETRVFGQRSDGMIGFLGNWTPNPKGLGAIQSPRRSPWDIDAWIKGPDAMFEIHRIIVLIPGHAYSPEEQYVFRQNREYVKARLMSEYSIPANNIFELNAPPQDKIALRHNIFIPVANRAKKIKDDNAAEMEDDDSILPAKVEVLFYITSHGNYETQMASPYLPVPEAGLPPTLNSANFNPPTEHQGGLNALYDLGGNWTTRAWGSSIADSSVIIGVKGMLESELKELIKTHWQSGNPANNDVDVVFEVIEACNSFSGGI